MSSSKKDKAVLRQIYLSRRQALTPEQVSTLNQQIYRSLIEFISWDRIKMIHLYLPITTQNEVDTYPVIDYIQNHHQDIQIAVPTVAHDNNFLDHYYLMPTTQLKTSKWGIPEPVEATPVPVNQIELVLVPMLVFDKSGNRIGYGKGHYDRFLAECRSETQKIGLCYFDPVDKIEVEPTDIAMDLVVTPRRVWEF